MLCSPLGVRPPRRQQLLNGQRGRTAAWGQRSSRRALVASLNVQREAEPEVLQIRAIPSHIASGRRPRPPAGLQGERAQAGAPQSGRDAVSGIGSCCTSAQKRWNR